MSRSGCVLSSILLLLAGCAATPYQPANSEGYGYAEQRDAGDAYSVMFVANTATSEQQAQDFALLRAAELGASLGFTYIKVVDSKSGVIMLKSHGGSSGGGYLPATAPSGGGGYGMGGMGMGGGYGGGGYGGNGSYSFGSSSAGATPARVGVARVRFLKQLADGDSAQPIQPLVARLRSAYGLSSSSGTQ
ncbi:MAG TPA: hypothetical protein VGT99_06605 [Gammaproteobacteria bacterium]|nr:hypothetical protein [Gammaproteobacteria bacterium]